MNLPPQLTIVHRCIKVVGHGPNLYFSITQKDILIFISLGYYQYAWK